MVNRVWRWHFGAGTRPHDRQLRPARRTARRIRSCSTGWRGRFDRRRLVAQVAASADPVVEHLSAEQHAARARRWPAIRRTGSSAGPTCGGWKPRRCATRCWPSAASSIATIGGSLLKVKNRGYFFDHTSKDLTDYTSRRRSLYLPVIRNNVYDVFQLLDFPDPAIPSGDRAHDDRRAASPADAQQRPGHASGGRFRGPTARRNPATTTSGSSRMYRCRLRPPGHCGRNRRRTWRFSRRRRSRSRQPKPIPIQRRRQAWSVLCQTILAANEFMYVQVMSTRPVIPAAVSRRAHAAPVGRRLWLARPGLAAWRTNRAAANVAGQSARREAAAFSRAGQADHLSVHEGRAVARRYVRSQAAARRATTASRCRSPSRACSSPRPATCSSSPWKFQQYGESGTLGQRAVSARRPSASTTCA